MKFARRGTAYTTPPVAPATIVFAPSRPPGSSAASRAGAASGRPAAVSIAKAASTTATSAAASAHTHRRQITSHLTCARLTHAS
ncbi:MAG: hypothetical protein JO262_08870 [Solirubrobacterales bacterium]|nr:hypothetical protein [Solirubrobacterales bacterium]